MSRQIGVFCLFMGLLGLIIFWGTLIAREPLCIFGVGSLLLTVLGIYLFVRNRPPGQPSERFRAYRKWREEQIKKKSGWK